MEREGRVGDDAKDGRDERGIDGRKGKRIRRRDDPNDIDELILDLAGVIGFDPGPYTLRQLMRMSRSAQRERWNHTSNILSLIFNVNRDSKKTSLLSATDFHPLDRDNHEIATPEQQQLILKEKFSALKDRVFFGKVTETKPFRAINDPEGEGDGG